jgi:hypothetical protein
VSYYSVQQIHNIDTLKSIFPDGKADGMNWCFLSTSGVHGSYLTLKDLEEYPSCVITVLVVKPRICQLLYGNFPISEEDRSWLKGLVASTIDAVIYSQVENLPDGWRPTLREQ